MIMYHATYGEYVPIIAQEGLLSRFDGNSNDNWGWGTEFTDEIFLSDDRDVAASYCECARNVPDYILDSGIYLVVLELDESEIERDPWVQAESSFVHHGPIYPDRFIDIVQYC